LKTISEFVKSFEGAKRTGSGYQAKCPAHDDRVASLSIGEGDDGRILLKCHAGCPADAVLARVGMGWSDVLPERGDGRPQEVATYDYRDEKGELLYQVVRFHPKDFRQRKPDGKGGYIWKVEGVRKIPYRLRDLIKAKQEGQTLYVVEGEKDADLLWSMGYPATTNAGGAGKWHDLYSEFFEGAEVVIIPDNDKTGAQHAVQVHASLTRYRAAAIHTVELPGLPDKGDVSDWFRQSRDNTRERFDEIVYEYRHISELDRQASEQTADVDAAEARERTWWNLSDLVATTAIREPEGFLYGEMFCRGRIGMIFGPGGSGKSYLVMFLASQIALGRNVHNMPTRPGRVLFLSEEMGGPDIRFRTRLCFPPETIAELSPNRFGVRWHTGFDFYGAGKTLTENKSVNDFVRICDRESNKPDLVFIDSLSRVHHAKENDNTEMGVVMANLEMAARLANVAIVFIHHAGKSSEFREGSERARGASIVRDFCQDVISVHCVSKSEKKSVITIEKAQSLAGGKETHPFVFTQEVDPTGRTVEKADGKHESAVSFVTAGHDEKALRESTAERDANLVFNTVRTLVEQHDEAATPDGKVERKVILERLAASFRWSTNKTDRALKRLLNLGRLEREQKSKDVVLISLPTTEN
jgi:RecA-family ATPase